MPCFDTKIQMPINPLHAANMYVGISPLSMIVLTVIPLSCFVGTSDLVTS
jgi:hypothetical protein